MEELARLRERAQQIKPAALGRLTKVTHPDGSVENYTLDAAGNRVQFDTTGGAPSVPAAPASISGPSMSLTGNYTISWSASTGASRYELWESHRTV